MECDHQFACVPGDMKCLKNFQDPVEGEGMALSELCDYCHYQGIREILKKEVEEEHIAVPESVMKPLKEIWDNRADFDIFFCLHLEMERHLEFYKRLTIPLLRQARHLKEQFEKELCNQQDNPS